MAEEVKTKYYLDYYDDTFWVWKPTGQKYDTQEEAIIGLDEWFETHYSKFSYRIIASRQKVIAQRLIAKKI